MPSPDGIISIVAGCDVTIDASHSDKEVTASSTAAKLLAMTFL
jgi:hypothetical protein